MIQINRRFLLLAGVSVCLAPAALYAQAFDHQHTAWSGLLKKHVILLRNGQASQVNYAGFAKDQAALQAYLDSLSSVTRAQFSQFSKAQQQAFLMNAYNAFTVALILTKYPDLESIKDLGSLFSSPWKKEWVSLLGDTVSLDNIEHDMLRKPGVYDEPRVHFVVNCASVGCPMLREEAYVANRLEQQLAQQALRFMSDRSRNHFNVHNNTLVISEIFDWYGGDFEKGYHGIDSVAGFAAGYADVLTDDPKGQKLLREQKAHIAFLDYDWALNDVS